MPEIGIRDLKMKASKVVQTVHKRKTRYTITRRGRPVAMLVPIDEAPPRQSGATMSADEVWNELTGLGKRLAQSWPEGTSSADILSNMRR